MAFFGVYTRILLQSREEFRGFYVASDYLLHFLFSTDIRQPSKKRFGTRMVSAAYSDKNNDRLKVPIYAFIDQAYWANLEDRVNV
jgi:hypothetical protein